MLRFEFIIEGPPVSQQTRRRHRLRAWVARVRQEAQRSWPRGEPPTPGPVMVGMTYLYGEVAVDLDNLAKPVLDALKGVAYADDGQVTDVVIRKRALAGVRRVEQPSTALAAAVDRGREFLHVVVTDAPDQEVLG